MGFSAVVLESDPKLAQSLASGLSSQFSSVLMTRSREEFRERISGSRPAVAILDMECSRLNDVSTLRADFPHLAIVCTYRVPDDQLWIAAIDAGASDVCRSGDLKDVLNSALKSMAIAKSAAA